LVTTGAVTFLVFDETVEALCKRSKTEPSLVVSAFLGILEGFFVSRISVDEEVAVIVMRNEERNIT
jgi:hypothetical protein